MKFSTPPLTGLALCLIGFLPISIARAGTVHQYSEDFSTTQYRDVGNTTALWDTGDGELKLPPFTMSLVGFYDTAAYSRDVSVSGNYAFMADVSGGVVVVDISDPTAPVFVKTFAVVENGDSDILAVGNRLIVADGLNGFRILDITDPTNPSPDWLYDTPAYVRGVNAYGDLGFASEAAFQPRQSSFFYIFDISNPALPSRIGQHEIPGFGQYVDVEGNLASVAATGNPAGNYLFDISDPTTPVQVGSIETPDYNREVELSGSYAYLAVGANGLWAVDISDPTTPTMVGNHDPLEYAVGVGIDGDYAYLADREAGVTAYDISDPTLPVRIGQLLLVDQANKVDIEGDLMYVADGAAGLRIVRVAQNTEPKVAGTLGTLTSATGIDVDGNHAYVADMAAGLRIVDIVDPTSPSTVGTYDTAGEAHDVIIAGTIAYIADGTAGLQAIDISEANTPAFVGSYDTSGSAFDVAVGGDYAYIADGAAGLRVIDILDPTTPTLAGTHVTAGDARAVVLADDHVYVAANDAGLRVINITDPTTPTFVGGYDSPGTALGVALSGDVAFLADGSAGIRVVDISNPGAPSGGNVYDTPGVATRVTVVGEQLFVADGAAGTLIVLDISDPLNPTLLSGSTETGTTDLFVWGDHAFVVDPATGLRVFEVFERAVDQNENLAQSTNLNAGGSQVIRARLATTQSTQVDWELTADGGVNWQSIVPGSSWTILAMAGPDLRWRSTHIYASPGQNPMCSDLQLDWLFEPPSIDAIVDVEQDTGGFVNVHFARSGHEFNDAPEPVTSYDVYRRSAIAPFDWELVGSTPASASDDYIVTVATHADSSGSPPLSTYYVSARTDQPAIFFDSPPDSGYSVDNTVAVAFAAFSGKWSAAGVKLDWTLRHADGLVGFHVYRAKAADGRFIQVNDALLEFASSFIDGSAERGRSYWYRVGIVDTDGEFLSPIARVDVPAASLALYQNYPNPFNPKTTIAYEVPTSTRVALDIFDVAGRHVRTLVSTRKSAGSHIATWDGRDDRGLTVASGIYFYRLRSSGRELTRKMVLIE